MLNPAETRHNSSPLLLAGLLVVMLFGGAYRALADQRAPGGAKAEKSVSKEHRWPKLQALDLNDGSLYSNYALKFEITVERGTILSQPKKPMWLGRLWVSNKSPRAVYVTLGNNLPICGVWDRRLWICNSASRELTLLDDMGIWLMAKVSLVEDEHEQVRRTCKYGIGSSYPSVIDFDVPSFFTALGEKAEKSQEGSAGAVRLVIPGGKAFTTFWREGKGSYPCETVALFVKEPGVDEDVCMVKLYAIEVNHSRGPYNIDHVAAELSRKGFEIRRIALELDSDEKIHSLEDEAIILVNEAAHAANAGTADRDTADAIRTAIEREEVPAPLDASKREEGRSDVTK